MRETHFGAIDGAIARTFEDREYVMVARVEDNALDRGLWMCEQRRKRQLFCARALIVDPGPRRRVLVSFLPLSFSPVSLSFSLTWRLCKDDAISFKCIVSELAKHSEILLCVEKSCEIERLSARSIRDASARRIRAGHVAGAFLEKANPYRAQQEEGVNDGLLERGGLDV